MTALASDGPLRLEYPWRRSTPVKCLVVPEGIESSQIARALGASRSVCPSHGHSNSAGRAGSFLLGGGGFS